MTMESQQLHSLPPPPDSVEEVSGPHNREMEERKVVTEGKKNSLKGESSLINHGKSMLTPTQWMEIQQQGLIFKHLKAGLPVPLHLVIPIWKSVASSFGSDVAGFYKRYPSFVGFSPLEFDYRTMKDAEPWRCRRTDGKKWRCSKNVVPDQKYCERHMHRGRQCSRKLVEASEIVSPSGTTSNSEILKTVLTHSQNHPRPQSPLPLSIIPPSNSKISTAVSTLFQLTATFSRNINNVTTTSASTKDEEKNSVLFSAINDSKNVVKGSLDSVTTIAVTTSRIPDTTISIPRHSTVTTSPTVMTITTVDEDNDVNSSKRSATAIPISVDTAAMIPTCDPSTGTSAANKTTNCINNKKNCNIGWKCNGCNRSGTKSIMNISNRSGNNHSSYASAGLGFSPKSVLQVLGCSGSCFYRSDMELEPGRCRRTDGKKWRCSRGVVPYQKYCGRHMHRGAKKRVENFQSVTTATSSVCLPRTMTISNEADSATLNTNLSISIPRSPQLVNNDEKSPTTSSDATISDTTITAYENSNFCS